MSPRNFAHSAVRVLAAALILDGGLAGACIHGAKGNEQTSVVNGNTRVDRIRMKPEAKQIMKVFVGPRGLKIGSTIRGVALSGEAAEIHKGLATEAAAIGREGQPVTRGFSPKGGGMSFEGTDVTGVLTELTAAAYPDWAAVVAKLKIESRGSEYDGAYTNWLRKIQSSGRAAYALQVDAGAGPVPMLAVQITYSGGDNTADVVSDKMFETAAADEVPSITWFQGLSNEAVDKAVGLVAASEGGSERGKNFSYNLAGVGTANIRSRTWNAYDASTQKSVARTGIVWMK